MKTRKRISRTLAVAIWKQTLAFRHTPTLVYKPLLLISKNNTMERNTVTTAANLRAGDVFYRQGDKDKKKFRVHVKKDIWQGREQRVICVEASLPESLADKRHLQLWLAPRHAVVFLRRPDPAEAAAAAGERLK
jgi:hypothetical protein